MCGILGIIVGENADLSPEVLKYLVKKLYVLSESRGKEASGIAVRVIDKVYVLKMPVPSSEMIKTEKFKEIFKNIINSKNSNNLNLPLAIIGHSRLVTSGESESNLNNHPIIGDGAIIVHNGVIANYKDLWKQYSSLKKESDVDTEVLVKLLQMFRKKENLPNAAKKVFSCIEGSASIATLFDDTNEMLLATNVGSLYICQSNNKKVIIFASEKHILEEVLGHSYLKNLFDPRLIFEEVLYHSYLKNLFDPRLILQIKPGTGCIINITTAEKKLFNLNDIPQEYSQISLSDKVKIIDLSPSVEIIPPDDKSKYKIREDVKEEMIKTWEKIYGEKTNIKRCKRCLLPNTVPFIEFDEEGICNFCKSFEILHKGRILKGEEELKRIVEKYKSTDGSIDCVVGFSGGRDSTYGLDYIKNVLGMHPVTFTYDWGMVNDLARRNTARVLGKMGVEQILISANLKKKRENIRKNLEAWLKKPELGMVFLLTAGDKAFYYYFHKIRKDTGAKLFIFCGGYPAEETPSKYGFMGIKHGITNINNRLTGISLKNKIKTLLYYIKQYIKNPSYLNSSVFDTLFAYFATYFIPDDYLYLYHYIEWDEKRIISAIKEKYNWELANDTIATWRIDDGTAPFYNYIYLSMAGFTEFDDFRSYQIREGKLTREEAYELIKEENKPRFEAIEDYAKKVGFDVNRAIKIINSTKKLYKFIEE